MRTSAALFMLGGLSSLVYAGTPPAARWLGSQPLAIHQIAFALLFGLYLGALRVTRQAAAPAPRALGVVLGFGLVFRLLVLPTPVYLSSDAYRYIWDGRVQLRGVNPYRYPPAAPELAALRDAEIYPGINRPSARTVYPPAAEWLFALAAAVTPGTIRSWRLLLLVGEVATVGLLLATLRRLGRPATSVLAYVWSPLVVYEGAQAGHIDLAVIPVILLALAWRQAGSSVRAGATLGVAVLMKLYPALLLPVWWRPRDWRFPSAVAATVALGYVPYAASLGLGALGFLPQYLSRAEDHNIGLRAVVEWSLGVTSELGRGALLTLFFGLLIAVLIAIGRRHRSAPDLWRATTLGAGAYLLLVPTSMHPWYVLVMVPFLCAGLSPGWLYFSGAVTLSYVKYLLEPTPFPWWLWVVQWVPLYALLGGVAWWSRRRRGPTLAAMALAVSAALALGRADAGELIAGPAPLIVEGERWWRQSPDPENPVACATCHYDRAFTAGWAASFPKVRPLPPPHARVMTLLQANAEAVARHYRVSDPKPVATAITAYLADLGADLPVSPGVAAGQPVFAGRLRQLAVSVRRGAATFAARCAECHRPAAVAAVVPRFPRVRDGRPEALETFLEWHSTRNPRLTWDGQGTADLTAYLMSRRAGYSLGRLGSAAEREESR